LIRTSPEVEGIEPDGVLEIGRVDRGIERDAQHLARSAIDQDFARGRVREDRAVGHQLHGDPQTFL